jgi:formate hydrogenlyase subunit 3/multisubunit Na+/H+ antiporter MnhD subunit
MAKGRPALATMLMATGVIALAVPGSTAFAGEFAILAGVFRQGWVWAAIGAGAIVLAAMYMLRLISAVLHQQRGSAVTDTALDLRPAELGILVPLVVCLLALSAWPAAITDRAFAQRLPRQDVSDQFDSCDSALKRFEFVENPYPPQTSVKITPLRNGDARVAVTNPDGGTATFVFPASSGPRPPKSCR